MNAVVWVVSAVPTLLTLLPLVKTATWWVRLWDYPRSQLAIALGVVAVLQLALLPASGWHLALLAVTLGCLAWQLWLIAPYTRLWPRQVQPAIGTDPDDNVRIMVANVLQDNRRVADFLQRVADADPDIVLAVETNGWWDARIAVLAERYPYNVRHPLENTYGMHLFSRLELSDVRVLDRVEENVPSIEATLHLRSGELVRLYCVHPEPPQRGNDVEERDAELLLVAQEARRDPRPAIVCGDLNDVAWSHTTSVFQRTSGLLDPRIGRGLYASFHAEHWFARWPLDHVFHDVRFRLVQLRVLEYFGSDHFAILVELQHDRAAAAVHEAPTPDDGDREEASEKIVEGREAAKEGD